MNGDVAGLDLSGTSSHGSDDGNLYELNAVTGASRLIGPTGVEQMSGMSQRVLR